MILQDYINYCKRLNLNEKDPVNISYFKADLLSKIIADKDEEIKSYLKDSTAVYDIELEKGDVINIYKDTHNTYYIKIEDVSYKVIDDYDLSSNAYLRYLEHKVLPAIQTYTEVNNE